MSPYILRVGNRAIRTGLQVLTGYFVVAHTIGSVDWRTAILATALAMVLSVVQALVDLPPITGIGVGGDIVARAVRTAAQTTLATAGANVILITDVPWPTVLGAAALAAVTSVTTSLIALPIGGPGVKGTTEII
jgi:hypothetical protein